MKGKETTLVAKKNGQVMGQPGPTFEKQAPKK